MYQICLVIKEDMKDEIGGMLVRGFDSLSDAAEQMLIDFERLNDADELSAKVDKLFEKYMDQNIEDLNLALDQLAEAEEIMEEIFR